MKSAIKRALSVVSFVILFAGAVSLVANASDFGPRGRHGRGGNTGRPPVQQVAEPAALVLLGAGLVSLGFYAKKKLGKKQ